MNSIYNYTLNDLQAYFEEIGESKYRASQVFDWLYVKRVKSFDDMTNLSIDLREKLNNIFDIKEFRILKKQVASDGTKKYLFDVFHPNYKYLYYHRYIFA